MDNFVKKTGFVDVSRFSNDGWWLGNGKEHVVAGTTLPPDCTEIIYTPSELGKTGKFNPDTNTWNEHDDNSGKEYFDQYGNKYTLANPDDQLPDWAINTAPPAVNDNHVVLFKDGAWVVYEDRMGQKYYDRYGNELTVSTLFFDLPENCTFDAPPKPDPGEAVKLIAGSWQTLEDHREKTVYAKDRQADDLVIKDLGPIPDTHTDQKPNEWDVWNQNTDSWVEDPDLKKKIETQQANENRAFAYADPINGSDRLFIQALHQKATGDDDEATKLEKLAIERVKEIDKQFPLPS